MLIELKWSTVQDMLKQETASNVFNSINGLALTYLSTQFTRNTTREIVSLINTETDLLLAIRTTSDGQKAFSFRRF